MRMLSQQIENINQEMTKNQIEILDVVKFNYWNEKIYQRNSTADLSRQKRKINELVDWLMEIIQSVRREEKRMKKDELRDLWDIIKYSNRHIIEFPEGEEIKGRMTIWRKNCWKIPNFMENITYHIRFLHYKKNSY